MGEVQGGVGGLIHGSPNNIGWGGPIWPDRGLIPPHTVQGLRFSVARACAYVRASLVFVYPCMYAYKHVRMYVRMFAFMFVCVCTYVCVLVWFLCMHVCMNVCM